MSFRNCDESNPFIFISYSRNDNEKVDPFAKKLMLDGFNVWIDKAEMKLGDTWDNKASNVIKSDNCKVFLLFRSSSSIVSKAVYKEVKLALDMIRRESYLKLFIVDIEEKAENIERLYNQLKDDLYDASKNAMKNQLEDLNSKGALVDFYEEKYGNNILTAFYNDSYDLKNLYHELSDTKVFPSTDEMIISQNENIQHKEFDKIDAKNAREEIQSNNENLEVTSKKAAKIIKLRVENNVFYTKNQSEAMGKIYALVLNSNPSMLTHIINSQPHVALELDNRSQFRASFEFTVANQTVYVGTSFSMLDKLKEISKMCRVVSFDQHAVAFIDVNSVEHKVIDGKLMSVPSSQNEAEMNFDLHIKAVSNKGAKLYQEIATVGTSEYDATSNIEDTGTPLGKAATTKIVSVTVLGETYQVKNQNAAMIKAYEVLLQTYPNIVATLMNNQPIVSRNVEKKSQFKNYGEVLVNNEVFYVGTSLSLQDKLKYLSKLCHLAKVKVTDAVFTDANGNQHYHDQQEKQLV